MSLRSPKQRGFVPLTVTKSNSSAVTDARMNQDFGIPLAPIKSNNSTGARKAGEGIQNDFSTAPTLKSDSEKGGFFHHKTAGRRRVERSDSSNDDDVAVNGLGRLYKKIIEASVVFRYMVYVAPVAIVLAAPIIALAILKPNATLGGMRLYLFFVWLEIVWLSIWISKLIAKFIPFLFMFLCGVVSSGTRKYAMILKAVEVPLSLLGWAITNLVTFTALTQRRLNETPTSSGPMRWTTVMTRILGPLVIAAGIFLAEKLVIQLISINYHRRSFSNRIKDSKHGIFLLGLLYDASRTLFPMYCPEFREEDYAINDSIEAILQKSGYRHKKSGSATPMRLIGEVGRIGDKVTTVFGNIASEITGKQVFNPTSAHSIVVEALEKRRSSEALARRLWMSFVVEGKDALYVEDVEEVLGPGRQSEAQEIFAALDSDGNGDISLDEMIMKIVEMGQERKSISNSMRDVGQAIGVLDSVLIFILSIIIIFIFVAFQNTNFVTMLATAGTTMLSLSFVFAVTTQEFLGSCIFLFVKHPYDVGDRVDIIGPEKENLIVEQISLLYTVFKRIDTMKMVQVPNIVLNNLWIENVTRSKAMKEQIEIFIAFDTSLEDIELLRSEMEAFVRHPDNARDFQPDLILEAASTNKMDSLTLRVEIRHKSNWHNETVRAARRSKFMCALVLALRRVPINGPGGGGDALGHPNNPSYSVAVSDELATSARAQAKEDKNAKRMVPVDDQPNDDADEFNADEKKAAEQLNIRPPTDLMGGGVGFNTLRDDARTHDDTREESFEIQQRNDELDSLREGLLKRENTRGRRKPGEAVPPLPTSSRLGPQETNTSQSSGVHSKPSGFRHQISGVLDEEAGMGMGIHRSHSNASRFGGGTSNPVSPIVGGQGDVPVYVFPPTTPEAAVAAARPGNAPTQDYLSAGGSSSRSPGVGSASQARTRGMSLTGSSNNYANRPPVPTSQVPPNGIPRKPHA